MDKEKLKTELEKRLKVFRKIRNYLKQQDSFGDIMYNLSEKKILEANTYKNLGLIPKIGEIVFIPKGNAGKGVNGTVHSVSIEDGSIYCEEFDQMLYFDEIVKN